MSKMKKIITAGPLIKESVYTVPWGKMSAAARKGKKQMSSAAQKRMNAKYSWQKCELMLAANYVPGDLVCTLTYDDRHLPRNRKEAAYNLKYFRSKLAKTRKAHGAELKMLWNTESLTDSGRYHHHCVINASNGEDYTEILRCWGNGEIEFRPLKIGGEESYESLARYLCKEYSEKPGQRAWSYTRNLAKPETETFRVPDDETLQAPKGSTVLDRASEKTQFGSYIYIKYLFTPKRRKTRKHRKK